MIMHILGIETSCDETAAAFLQEKRGHFQLLSNVVSSQAEIHAQYGGVVPEVAARNHIAVVMPVIGEALGGKKPDAIAVTAGPGLITSLLVGVHTAKTLAYLWNVPLIAINHIEGHIYANWLEKQFAVASSRLPVFPAIVLIVSGGHTELILMKGHGNYALLGATRDDAAGECYDKAASILGLGYPGGSAIDKESRSGNPNRFPLPRPMIGSGDFEFSFSGLKTAVLYLVERLKKEKTFDAQVRADICASFQQAVADVLVAKTIAAAKKHHARAILMGGGVVANSALRAMMECTVRAELPVTQLSHPDLRYCTDNAAMIAMAGYFHARKKDFSYFHALDAMPRWQLAR